MVEALAQAYTSARGELADRLHAALVAGDDAGGDSRGKQAAAIYVAREHAGYGGDNDRYLDLRVDDDEEPVARLGDLINLHHLYFGVPKPEDRLPITADLASELQAILIRGDYRQSEPNGRWDAEAQGEFDELIGSENLEERWRNDDPNVIDRIALEYLRQKYGVK